MKSPKLNRTVNNPMKCWALHYAKRGLFWLAYKARNRSFDWRYGYIVLFCSPPQEPRTLGGEGQKLLNVYIYICVYAHPSVERRHIYVYTHTRTHTLTHHTHIHTHTCTHTNTHAHTRTHTHAHMYSHPPAHPPTHRYTHTHTHTHLFRSPGHRGVGTEVSGAREGVQLTLFVIFVDDS